MESLIKIKDKANLAKDPVGGGVINTDDSAFKTARQIKKKLMEEQEKQKNLELRVQQLELLVTKFLEKEIDHG